MMTMTSISYSEYIHDICMCDHDGDCVHVSNMAQPKPYSQGATNTICFTDLDIVQAIDIDEDDCGSTYDSLNQSLDDEVSGSPQDILDKNKSMTIYFQEIEISMLNTPYLQLPERSSIMQRRARRLITTGNDQLLIRLLD